MFLGYCRSIARLPSTIVIAGSILLLVSCGPEDYQKPIQGFQSATATVVAADRAFLSNENTNEQNLYIGRQVFEQKPLGPADIDRQVIISPAEIKLRTEALDALSQYTTNLATLAQGKAEPSTGQSMKASSTSLQTSAANASGQASTNKTQSNFNKRFSGLATAAATAIGAVAQAILDHKARNEIKKSVQDTDKQVTELISLISDDAQGSFLRQQSQLGELGVQLYKDYACEIAVDDSSASVAGTAAAGAGEAKDEVKCPKRAKGVQADPVALLALADRLKTFRTQQAALESANPAPAITQMEKAHEALVAYVSSDKNSESSPI